MGFVIEKGPAPGGETCVAAHQLIAGGQTLEEMKTFRLGCSGLKQLRNIVSHIQPQFTYGRDYLLKMVTILHVLVQRWQVPRILTHK